MSNLACHRRGHARRAHDRRAHAFRAFRAHAWRAHGYGPQKITDIRTKLTMKEK